MAVKYVQGSSPLSTLGAIAGLAGTLTGTPWLVPVGMGMGLLGGIASGQGVSAQGVAGMLGSLKDTGIGSSQAANNPAAAANNPVSSATSVFQNDEEAREFVKNWSRGGYRGYNRYSL